MALEFVSSDDWPNAVEVLEPYVSSALSSEPGSPSQQTLLALAAVCKARLALTSKHWDNALDWLLTGMNRSRLENDPVMDIPMSQLSLLIAAAMSVGDLVIRSGATACIT